MPSFSTQLAHKARTGSETFSSETFQMTIASVGMQVGSAQYIGAHSSLSSSFRTLVPKDAKPWRGCIVMPSGE